MSYDCTTIMNYSKKVSNNYNKCHQFLTNNGANPLQEGARECLDKYCSKPTMFNARNVRTAKVNGGVDLSAGVF